MGRRLTDQTISRLAARVVGTLPPNDEEAFRILETARTIVQLRTSDAAIPTPFVPRIVEQPEQDLPTSSGSDPRHRPNLTTQA